MNGNISQMAYVGDVWYQIMDKRQGENYESEFGLVFNSSNYKRPIKRSGG